MQSAKRRVVILNSILWSCRAMVFNALLHLSAGPPEGKLHVQATGHHGFPLQVGEPCRLVPFWLVQFAGLADGVLLAAAGHAEEFFVDVHVHRVQEGDARPTDGHLDVLDQVLAYRVNVVRHVFGEKEWAAGDRELAQVGTAYDVGNKVFAVNSFELVNDTVAVQLNLSVKS